MKKFRMRRMGRVPVLGFALLAGVVGLGILAHYLIGGGSPATAATAAPEDTTLTLTVPKMERVQDLPVYDTPSGDSSALDASAMHLSGTGFPWEEGANVYIAGHRLGYEGTASYLVFYDLDRLQDGDEVILTDANGTRYTYRVFRSFEVAPDEWSVTEPVAGKSIISLQTCTLPDYARRFVVQAELASVS